MLLFLFQILILILVTFITEIIAYRFVRYIDKSERLELQKWELNYLEKLRQEVKKGD